MALPAQVLDAAANASEEDFALGRVSAHGVQFLHKYVDGVAVDVDIEMGGGCCSAAVLLGHLGTCQSQARQLP